MFLCAFHLAFGQSFGGGITEGSGGTGGGVGNFIQIGGGTSIFGTNSGGTNQYFYGLSPAAPITITLSNSAIYFGFNGASTFNAAGATNLNASNIASGTLSTGIIPWSALTSTNDLRYVQLNSTFNASGATNLNASSVASGTLDTAFLPWVAMNATNDTRYIPYSGAFNASGATNLNASNVASGTLGTSFLPWAALTSTNDSKYVQLNSTFNASGATNLNASNLATGTVGAGLLPWSNLTSTNDARYVQLNSTFNASGATNLNASNIASGVLGDNFVPWASLTSTNDARYVQLNSTFNASGATNLNASSIASGMVGINFLPWSAMGSTNDAKYVQLNSTFNASGATNLNASNITSGTLGDNFVPWASLASTNDLRYVQLNSTFNASGATNLNASNLASGTVPAGLLPWSNLTATNDAKYVQLNSTFNASGATNLNASSITSGTVGVNYLPWSAMTSTNDAKYLPLSSTNGIIDLASRTMYGDWNISSSLTVPIINVATITNWQLNVTNLVLQGTANANGFSITNLLAGSTPLGAVNLTQLQGATNNAVWGTSQYPSAVLLDGSRAMSGILNFGNQSATNLANGAVASAAVNLAQLQGATNVTWGIAQYPNALLVDGSRAMSGILNFGNQSTTNLANGTVASAAVNLSQLQGSTNVSWGIAQYPNALLLDGSRAMSGILNFGNQSTTNLANGMVASAAVNLSQLQGGTNGTWNDSQYPNALLVDGSRAMSGILNFGNQSTTNLANGTVASAAVNLSQLQGSTNVTWGIAQYPSALLTDGSRAMSGILNFGTQSATNLANGSVPSAAVNYGQLTNATTTGYLKADGSVTPTGNFNWGNYNLSNVNVLVLNAQGVAGNGFNVTNGAIYHTGPIGSSPEVWGPTTQTVDRWQLNRVILGSVTNIAMQRDNGATWNTNIIFGLGSSAAQAQFMLGAGGFSGAAGHYNGNANGTVLGMNIGNTIVDAVGIQTNGAYIFELDGSGNETVYGTSTLKGQVSLSSVLNFGNNTATNLANGSVPSAAATYGQLTNATTTGYLKANGSVSPTADFNWNYYALTNVGIMSVTGLLTHGDSVWLTNVTAGLAIGTNTNVGKLTVTGDASTMTNSPLVYIQGSPSRNQDFITVAGSGGATTNFGINLSGVLYGTSIGLLTNGFLQTLGSPNATWTASSIKMIVTNGNTQIQNLQAGANGDVINTIYMRPATSLVWPALTTIGQKGTNYFNIVGTVTNSHCHITPISPTVDDNVFFTGRVITNGTVIIFRHGQGTANPDTNAVMIEVLQ